MIHNKQNNLTLTPHSQTSCLLISSLSLDVPVPSYDQPSVCETCRFLIFGFSIIESFISILSKRFRSSNESNQKAIRDRSSKVEIYKWCSTLSSISLQRIQEWRLCIGSWGELKANSCNNGNVQASDIGGNPQSSESMKGISTFVGGTRRGTSLVTLLNNRETLRNARYSANQSLKTVLTEDYLDSYTDIN